MINIGKEWIVTTLLSVGLFGWASSANAALRIEGQVQVGHGPLAMSTVTLWAANPASPERVGQAVTGADGGFVITAETTPVGSPIYYLVANGGMPTKGKVGDNNPTIALLSVLGNKPPAKVVVNELTTVASAFTAARFINGRIDLRESTRPSDRSRKRSEPGGSRDRQMGQGAA